MASLKELNGPLGGLYDGSVPVVGSLGAPGEAMTAGAGVTAGVGTIYRASTYRQGTAIKTDIYINLKGLKSGGTAADIIGVSGAANCHLGRVTNAVNGKVFAGRVSCLTPPTVGEPDIDVIMATVATGTQDAAGSSLTGYVLLQDHAADYTLQGQNGTFASCPTADGYLYLLTSGGADTGVYTAGEFLIELWGYPV